MGTLISVILLLFGSGGSDSHGKAFLAGRTAYGMLPFFLGKAQHRATMRTFFINVCFSVPETIAYPSEKAEETHHLISPLHSIFRKYAKQPICENQQLNAPHRNTDDHPFQRRGNNGKDPQDQIDPHQNRANCICTVPSVHHAAESSPESCKKASHRRLPPQILKQTYYIAQRSTIQ